MVTKIMLKPNIARYVEEKVSAGASPSLEAYLNALVEEKIAEEADYDRWFRAKVMQGIAAADSGQFATDAEVAATLHRWKR